MASHQQKEIIMSIGNRNNEMNARFHRYAVEQNMIELRDVGNEMQTMLDLPSWSEQDESRYDELYSDYLAIIARLKLQGMFLR